MLGVVVGWAGCDPNAVHRHQPFHEWRSTWCGSDENARPVAEPQAQHHGIEDALLITHSRYFVDDHHFRLWPAQRFRLLAREEHAHCAVWPFQPSPRRHPTRPRITAAGREYTALAFDVDIVKVGRGWGDEVNALDASAHRSMHRLRHRVRFAGAAAAEKQPAPRQVGRWQLCIARGKDPVLGRVIAQSSYQLTGFLRCHLVDVLAQLVHALNFTQKAISHRRRPFSRLRLRCRDLSRLLYYRRARELSRSSATRGRIRWSSSRSAHNRTDNRE